MGLGAGDSTGWPRDQPRRRRRLRGTPSRSSRSAAGADPRRSTGCDRRRPAAPAGRAASPDRCRRARRRCRRSAGARSLCGAGSRWCRRSPQLLAAVPSSADAERRRAGLDASRRPRLPRSRRRLSSSTSGASTLDTDASTTGRSNPMQQPRARRQLAELARDDLRRLAHDFLAAVAAVRSARPARTAAACSRGSRSSCRRSTADCGCCSSAGSRSPARCRRCDRRPASPCARGTGGRRRTAIRRSGAALRRRSCRRRATTFPIR